MVLTREKACETAEAAYAAVKAARRAVVQLKGLPSLPSGVACGAPMGELCAALREAGDNLSALVGALRPPEGDAADADPDELREAAREAAWW